MTHLEEILQTIQGLKLQTDYALILITDKSKETKNKLRKCQQMINPSIVYGKTLKWYMTERKIKIFPEIDIEDFKKWYKTHTSCDCRCMTALSSSEYDTNIIHLTNGILLKNYNENYEVIKEDIDIGTTSLCNLNINGIYGLCVGDPLIKYNQALCNLIKDVLTHEEDKIICHKCESIAKELYNHLYNNCII